MSIPNCSFSILNIFGGYLRLLLALEASFIDEVAALGSKMWLNIYNFRIRFLALHLDSLFGISYESRKQ